ncbi:hypothetical protein [Mycolicibacterium palauense]|uniref:hypothetical protein n=1 Tax=Mycolicibacterium palauense TaxID=2034511 RepID=UPI001FE6802F|nr:hypothetical protein [Mycolicibacterium palauense]
MGLSAALSRPAVRRAHVLMVEVPGYWVTRATLETHLLARGWRCAGAPAAADVLAVCGPAGTDLSGAIDAVWDQLPGPRVRVDVAGPADVDDALRRAAESLLDDRRHRDDAQTRSRRPELAAESGGMDHGGMDHGGMDHGGMDHAAMDHGGHGEMDHAGHGGMDHEGMDHGGMDHAAMDHGGMDHGGMDMAPEGIPLAGGTDDRDGLEMDELHAALGPVLPYWPAGLVLRCTLNGDVITGAAASLLDAGAASAGPARPTGPLGAARQCDHARNLLALAGWPAAAVAARRCRDAFLHGDPEVGMRLLDALHRRARRSRVLRWSLRGLAPCTAADLQDRNLPAWWEGDAYDRLLSGLRRAAAAGSASGGADDPGPVTPEMLDALPELVSGLDLAAARLVLAGVNIDTAVSAAVGAT